MVSDMNSVKYQYHILGMGQHFGYFIAIIIYILTLTYHKIKVYIRLQFILNKSNMIFICHLMFWTDFENK